MSKYEGNCNTKTDEKKTYILTYNANGGSVSPTSKSLKDGDTYGNLPTPSRNGYTFNGWYTKSSGGAKVNQNTTINGNTTIHAQWTKKTDNGNISLSASKTCLVKGQPITVTANVNNTTDSAINWSKDSCLTLSGSGNSRTVTGNNCGNSPWVKGTLNNSANNTVTLTYENTLTVTVKNNSGQTVNPTDGIYKGNNLTISTNIPATITGNYLSGNANTLRTSATTTGASDTTVTITTPCGQTKTVVIQAIIF